MLVPLVVLVPLHRTMQEVDGAWLATRLSRRNLLLLHVALLLLLLLPYGAAGCWRQEGDVGSCLLYTSDAADE